MKIVFHPFLNCLCQNPNLIFSILIDVVPIPIALPQSRSYLGENIPDESSSSDVTYREAGG